MSYTKLMLASMHYFWNYLFDANGICIFVFLDLHKKTLEDIEKLVQSAEKERTRLLG